MTKELTEMQTFLPYESYTLSAQCLDYKRLGKQRVEAFQIARVLHGLSDGWRNHPAVKMWQGAELGLLEYGICICSEWLERGYKDTLLQKFQDMIRNNNTGLIQPNWLGNKEFHASHRSNLLRKDPVYYARFGWNVPDNLPYIWPKGKDLSP